MQKTVRELRNHAKKARQEVIVYPSSSYSDHLHLELQHHLQENPNPVIHYHKNYVSRYVTLYNIPKKAHTDGEGTITESITCQTKTPFC